MSIKLLCEDHESGYERGDFLRSHPCFKRERMLQFYISPLKQIQFASARTVVRYKMISEGHRTCKVKAVPLQAWRVPGS
jgi:hypothetical protein